MSRPRSACRAWSGARSGGRGSRSARRRSPGRRRRREQRGHQVVGLHALDGRRVAAPPLQRSTTSARLRFHRHRLWNMGAASSTACSSTRAHGASSEEPGHVGQREAVVRPERQHDGVVVGRGLQLEVERDAEPLAQGQAERPVDPAAVGRVHDQVHALGVVEEPLEHEVVVGGARRPARPGRRPGSRRSDRRRRRRAAGLLQPGPGAVGVAHGQVAVDVARSSDTSSDSSAVRAGASPSQNGMVGGLPSASTTRTTPGRPGGSATSGCRAGRCRRPSTRWPSPR